MSVIRTPAQIRAAFASARINADAAKILGCSMPTAIKLGKKLGVSITQRGPKLRKIPMVAPPPPLRVPKERQPEPTQHEILEALLRHQSITVTAAHFKRSTDWLNWRIKLWHLHSFTGRPRIADPVAQKLDFDCAVIERAIMQGIWHIDADGELQQYDKADPFRGRHRNLLDGKRP